MKNREITNAVFVTKLLLYQPGTLKKHINSVHEGLKNHKCNLCDKAFSQPSDLKFHIHEGQKNHKCDLCG